jgi:hypothetical protein
MNHADDIDFHIPLWILETLAPREAGQIVYHVKGVVGKFVSERQRHVEFVETNLGHYALEVVQLAVAEIIDDIHLVSLLD